MLIVNHQDHISIYKDKNKAIEVTQYSLEYGCDISIWIQPENVKALCAGLLNASKNEVIK